MYNISAYSTALFSTWIFIEELGLLFDAGDGLSASLLQKSRKIKQVFISHADRDHLTGLIQFNQLNAREGYPKIHYPSDSGSFPALMTFLHKFELILSHFSTRYSAEEIDYSITKLMEKYKVKIPVYRILPGKVHRDILAEKPLFLFRH
jgi:ribonuclease BN (tRNA processing enzyme)